MSYDCLLGPAADFGSALAIELRRAHPPDARDFLRFKFKNGTHEDFETLHVFGHHEDIPLTEFIYRLEVRSFLIITFLTKLSSSALYSVLMNNRVR